MNDFLSFTIIGLTVAAIYAVIGSGLVLTYTTTGIFNFAHGAAGMFFAFVYWQMRFGWGWPAPVALVLVLLVLAPLFGVLLETVIMRGLENTSETIKLVVSISLLLFLIGLAQLIWKPAVSRQFPTFFSSTKSIAVGPTFITWHQIITIGVAIVVAIGFRLFLTRLRVGVAMRATVDDRSLAQLNGARPARVSMLAWAIATSLAALAGILIAPTISLDAPTLSLVIVSAYAAAIFGRLRSLPLTFVGAVIVGCAEGYALGYIHGSDYFTGFQLAVSAIILFIVLLVLPNPRLPGRSGRSREFFPMPSARGALAFALASVAFGVILATTLSGSDMLTYNKVFALGIVALSLVPLIGYGGQISLCQMSFAGIGAIVVSHLGATGNPLAIVYAVIIAAAVGALVALPALRLQGIYLALGTAAFALILDRWIFTMPKLTVFGLFSVSTFNQASVDVQPIKLFGDTIASPASQMVFGAIVFALVALLVTALRRGRLGRRLLAMKDSEAACATLGLNLLGTKLVVFAISAGIAGLGGAIYGMQLGSINPTYFSLVESLQVFALAVVGGIGAVGGALFAGVSLALVLPLLAALFPSLESWIPLLPGGAGIALGRNPNGAVYDMREGFMPLFRAKGVLAVTLVLMAVVYAIRLADVITNWPFVILMAAIPLVATGVAGFIRPATLETEEELASPEVPLEWRGIDQPWTAEDLEELDRAVGLTEVELHGAA